MEGDINTSLKQTLKDLGESSSLHGIPKIVASRQIAVKVLWGILLCGAVVLFCLQFRLLLEEFQSYPVKTSVALKFAALPFPAVTICNMNPVKVSALLGDSNDTSDLRADIYQHEVSTSLSYDDLDEALGNFYDTYGTYYDDVDLNSYISSLHAENEVAQDVFDSWKTSVLAELRDTPSDIRYRIGHHLDDFVLLARYAGFKFQPSEYFDQLLNSFYGTCFTIDDLPDTFTSGQDHGLTLELNLELNEYLEHLTSAYGVKVVIHEKGTLPLPEKEGFILNPGFETNVGLKLRRVKRLGGVYGTCDDSLEYAIGNTVYAHSVSLCHTICESQVVFDKCGCATLETPFDVLDARTCDTDDNNCMHNVQRLILDGAVKCECPTTCSEDSYVATITGRKWPFKSYLQRVMLQELCKDGTHFQNLFFDDCFYFYENNQTVYYEDYQRLSENFLKVNIYFEDLNYEEISEEPLYNTIRFLSDIGGMMGFFLGASLLTYVELMQLILEITIFMKQKYWNAKTKPATVTTVKPLK